MLAYYGGSFDPPHIGHSNCAISAAKELSISSLRLLPCKQSPLKQNAGANQNQRMDMLNLLCSDVNTQQSDVQLRVDDIELTLPSPTYTIETLKQVRKNVGKDISVCFLLGEDSLYTLHKWKDWHAITDYCHLVVLRRDGIQTSDDPACNKWIAQRTKENVSDLHTCSNGFIYFCQTPLIKISSSTIRAKLNNSPEFTQPWLSKSVANYISTHNLYTTK